MLLRRMSEQARKRKAHQLAQGNAYDYGERTHSQIVSGYSWMKIPPTVLNEYHYLLRLLSTEYRVVRQELYKIGSSSIRGNRETARVSPTRKVLEDAGRLNDSLLYYLCAPDTHGSILGTVGE